jgi:hypothetical protein
MEPAQAPAVRHRGRRHADGMRVGRDGVATSITAGIPVSEQVDVLDKNAHNARLAQPPGRTDGRRPMVLSVPTTTPV